MTDGRLVEFVQLLRQNGLRVSPGEVAEAARALLSVSMDDPAQVRAALRACLVKRGADAPTFDRLFALQFGAVGRLLEGLEETLSRGLDMSEFTLEEMQEVAAALASLGQGSQPLTQAVLGGQLGVIARLLRTAALRVDFKPLQQGAQKGFVARRVQAAAGVGGVAKEFQLLEQALSDAGIDPALVERVSARLQSALDALEDTARRVVDVEDAARASSDRPDGTSELSRRSLNGLSVDEKERMRLLVKTLAEKVRSRLARRRRTRRRGTLHVRRTLRINMALGGLPARLRFRSRRPQRPELVILCDVSDSVRGISRVALQFLHTLQSLYSRVRTFVFVSDLADVTPLLKIHDVDEVVDGVVTAKVLNLAANSNYGHALRQFHADFRGCVTGRTTVLVIGDGRSNYNPSGAWVLEDLARRAQRIVWLCPEERRQWGFGDSEMNTYARHCTQVFTVRNIEEFEKAALSLAAR